MFALTQATLVSLLVAVVATAAASVADAPVARYTSLGTNKSAAAKYIRFSEQGFRTDRCIGVKDSLFQKNQPVQLSYCNATDSGQHWQWSGDNLVAVSDTGKHYCLDAGDATPLEAKPLLINECNNSTATQNWSMSIAPYEGFGRLLKLKAEGVCVLRVPSNTVSNADLQAGACDFYFGINQGWTYF